MPLYEFRDDSGAIDTRILLDIVGERTGATVYRTDRDLLQTEPDPGRGRHGVRDYGTIEFVLQIGDVELLKPPMGFRCQIPSSGELHIVLKKIFFIPIGIEVTLNGQVLKCTVIHKGNPYI